MLTAWEDQPNRWWWADHPLLCSCTRSSSPLSFFQTSSTCPFPLARATGIKSAPVATMVVSPLSALYHPAASLSPGHPPTVLQTRKNEDLFGKFLSSNFRSALRNDKLKKQSDSVYYSPWRALWRPLCRWTSPRKSSPSWNKSTN